MSFATLAVISAAALLGPLLAWPKRLHLPVLLGELVAGVLLGRTGINLLHPREPAFALLASIGFTLVMFVAGTHVPVADPSLRGATKVGAIRSIAVGAIAVPLAWSIAQIFATGHAPLYAVLIASSSAALALPVVYSLRLSGKEILRLTSQVAISDAVCIVALPLAIDPRHALRAGLGSIAVIGASIAMFFMLRQLERSGIRQRIHHISSKRKLALELRVNLVILFSLAALAVATRTSVLLAGFCFGLAVAAVGEPRRLARQLFALTEGFLGPLFFIWLGASLDVRALGRDPSFIVLGVVLGLAAVGAHLAMRLIWQPLSLGALAAAQLGVPIGAVTIGAQLHVLTAGEASAIVLAAIITIAVAVWAGSLAARAQPHAVGR